eukprot:scaffold132022_cov30-Tisochrysis_lutea.AAC.1
MLKQDLEAVRQRETDLINEVRVLKENLSQCRADADRSLRRAIQEGQRREAALSASLKQVSADRDTKKTELSRLRALLTKRDRELAVAQSNIRAQRIRLEEINLQLQQESFVRAQIATKKSSQTCVLEAQPCGSTTFHGNIRPSTANSADSHSPHRRTIDDVAMADDAAAVSVTHPSEEAPRANNGAADPADSELALAQEQYISRLLSTDS